MTVLCLLIIILISYTIIINYGEPSQLKPETELNKNCFQIEDSIDYILLNFAEMNKLWVRMQHQVTALQNGFSSVLTAGASKLECLSLVIKYEPHYTITILGSIIDIHFYGTFSTYSLN